MPRDKKSKKSNLPSIRTMKRDELLAELETYDRYPPKRSKVAMLKTMLSELRSDADTGSQRADTRRADTRLDDSTSESESESEEEEEEEMSEAELIKILRIAIKKQGFKHKLFTDEQILEMYKSQNGDY